MVMKRLVRVVILRDVGGLGDVHTPRFLNTINSSGLPNHILKLKVGGSCYAFEECGPKFRVV